MIIPEGAEPDKYQTTFIYRKNGEQKEFSLDNYPAGDTGWVFVDQKTVLLKKGYRPLVHDFAITGTGGADLTSQILADKGYSLLMISKKLNDADTDRLSAGFDLGKHLAEIGISFYVLTATSSEELQKYANELNFCTVDETTLKTMVRANPGYMLLKDGVIKGKWSWASLPEKEWFNNISDLNKDQKSYTGNRNFTVISIVTSLLLILIILGTILKDTYSEKTNK